MKKRIVSLLLALVMVLSLVPTTVWAAEDHDGQVRVIVENTTYAKADGAAWDGTLVDKWVDLVPGSTMMDCIVSALGSYSQTGADSGYISEINGLTAGDGGAASGWMGTLNDWFTNVGFKDIKAGDKLFAGDIIRVMYTVNGYGADIGGDWNTQSDTSLAALSFSEGVLTPDFASDKTAYTLTLPQGVTGIRMTATASNKNNQVYLSADGTDYRRVETVPVHNGTVLTIRCGDKAAATEWSPAITPTTYTVTVSQEGDAPQGDMDVSFKGLHNAQLSDIKVYTYADGVKGDKNLLDGLDSMSFITKQSVNGPVWALLALDSHGYPTSGDVTREKLVRAILDTQREDGSWPVIASSQVPDVDMTAMAIQALAPYYENAQVKAAVDAALTFLAGAQNADGTFSEIPGTDASAESTAQVIVALTALGIDPTADSRFVKSGVSVVDALCGFYVTGGGFRHLMDDADVDGMATDDRIQDLDYVLRDADKLENELTVIRRGKKKYFVLTY